MRGSAILNLEEITEHLQQSWARCLSFRGQTKDTTFGGLFYLNYLGRGRRCIIDSAYVDPKLTNPTIAMKMKTIAGRMFRRAISFERATPHVVAERQTTSLKREKAPLNALSKKSDWNKRVNVTLWRRGISRCGDRLCCC